MNEQKEKTVNQKIAEFMGVCPEHKPNMKRWKGEYEMPCVNCEKPAVHHSNPIPGPSYTTDLNEIAKVEAKVIETFGLSNYFNKLTDACIVASTDGEELYIATAPASVRVKAVVSLIEEKENGR